MTKYNKRKGFTVIEMLVVIAVIALLVSIVIPVFSDQTVKAKAAVNAAKLRTIEGAISVFQLDDPESFENFAKTGEALEKLESLPVWGWVETLFGETTLAKKYNTRIATNGSITISLNPNDVTINDIPQATPLKAPSSTSGEVVIYENTPMTIYFLEEGAIATYQGYTAYDFADIAEDGIYDGNYDPSDQDNLEDGWFGHFGMHKDETGNCICDYKGCGAEFHPGHKDYRGDSEFCDNVNPACPYQRDYTKTYCSVHGCDTIIVGGTLCEAHTCPGCKNEKEIGEESCDNCQCTNYNCTKLKVEGSNYCTDHKCANSSCKNKRPTTGQYCDSCECQENYCTNGKVSGSNYCTDHKCKSNDCNKKANRGGYCDDHGCTHTTAGGKCGAAPTGGSSYCSSHKCANSSCKNKRPTTGQYCDSCECQENYCTNGKVSGSNYCTDHKCRSCNLKANRSGYCDDHNPNNDPGCITPDTLITLADGTKKRADQLDGSEELLVWNLETGAYDSAPIMFIDSEAECEAEVIYLHFSDGTLVKVITEHGFWDYTLNMYVYLDRGAEAYIGHTFFKQSENGGEKVELVDVEFKTEVTTAWSPVTVGHLCYFVNDMLSMPGGIRGLFNIFDVDPETMTYDYEAMARDIETYGLLSYEELSSVIAVPEDMFNAAGGAYLNIAMGKGQLTEGELFAMIQRYSVHFE